MKKNILNFIVTLLMAMILSQFLPWWSVMVSAFITAVLIRLNGAAVFFIPFAAVGILWVVQAYWLGQANDFILGKKIAQLLPLDGKVFLLIIITGLIGGLASGIAGIFGKQCADLISDKSTQ